VRSDTFVQTNYSQMLVLYRTALEMLEPKSEDRVLDLYAGIGTISVAAARDAAGVTAIEENPHAVQLGRLNARINNARVEYVAGQVGMALGGLRLGRHRAVLVQWAQRRMHIDAGGRRRREVGRSDERDGAGLAGVRSE
jgi:ribosomal protein L11 methylase PrmA